MFVLISLKNEKEILEKYFLYKKKKKPLELHQNIANKPGLPSIERTWEAI